MKFGVVAMKKDMQKLNIGSVEVSAFLLKPVVTKK
jgi:hypothetical protein